MAGIAVMTSATSLFAPTIPLLVLLLIVYFTVLRPNRVRVERGIYMSKQIQPGAYVVTRTGLRGEVLSVSASSIWLLSGDTELEIERSSIRLVEGVSMPKNVRRALRKGKKS